MLRFRELPKFRLRLSTVRCSNSCKMDTKQEIKEEDPLSDDVALQNDRELFTKNVTMKAISDAMLLEGDYMSIKTEIESETPFPNFYSEKERECFTKQIEFESVTYGNNCRIDTKIEVGSQSEREFLADDAVMKVKKYNNDHEMDNKVEIKEESWWLKTETSSVYDDIKDRDFAQVKSQRFNQNADGKFSRRVPAMASSDAYPTLQ